MRGLWLRVGLSEERVRLCVLLLSLVCAVSAAGAAYPDKPIRLLVGYPPGGGADLVARVLSAELGKTLGKTVVVDNRPGADGSVAAQTVARAAPDGYTLLHIPANIVFSASLRDDLPYDLAKDFEAISLVASAPLAMAVGTSVPAKSVREFIELSRSRPGGLNYGSSGVGGASHFAAELFKSVAKVNLVHVSYKGSAPSLLAVMTGEVNVTFSSLPAALPHMKRGALRILAVTSNQRVRAAPELPTAVEGGLPGYEFATWYGFVAPAGTPLSIRLRLHGEIAKALAVDHVQARLLAEGAEPVGSDPNAFRKFLAAEVGKWKAVVKATGIVAQ